MTKHNFNFVILLRLINCSFTLNGHLAVSLKIVNFYCLFKNNHFLYYQSYLDD